MAAEGSVEPARRVRPKDRSDRIVQVATALFGQRGYLAVSLDEVGEAVGISGPAVYRHFASKESLLVAVVDNMMNRYFATATAALAAGSTPEEQIAELVERMIVRQVDEENFWPWVLSQQHHLPRESVRAFARRADEWVRMWVAPLQALHPALGADEAAYMVELGAGLTTSLLHYDAQMSRKRAAGVLTRILVGALVSYDDSPSPEGRRTPVEAAPTATAPLRSSARERILAQAVPLFRRRGFAGTGVDEIGSAAGTTGPAVYRYFRNKGDLLYTALARMNERLAISAGTAFSGVSDPAEALERLVDSYLDLLVEQPDLVAVYWDQKRSLSDEQLTTVARGERSYVEDWVGVVRRRRTGVTEAEAKVMTYGAIGLMNGYLRARAELPPEAARSIVRGLVLRALAS